MSLRMLTATVRNLERDGMLTRHVYHVARIRRTVSSFCNRIGPPTRPMDGDGPQGRTRWIL